MVPARNLARQIFARAVLIVLPAVFPAFTLLFAAPQQSPKAPPAPAPRSIVLPRAVVAGAPATLAVLDAAGRLTPNVAVELSGGQNVTTDVTGRALFTAPREEGVLTARFPKRNVAAVVTVAILPAPVSPEGTPPEAQIISYPHFISIHDQFAIAGSGFRGEADANRVFLGDVPCLVLAASPVSLVVLPGLHLSVGDMRLRISVSGRDAGGALEAPSPVSVVSLEVSGPAETIRAGESGMLTIRARGTPEGVAVEVRNTSPKVIQLTRGNVQRVKTSGGDANVAQIEMKFVTSGDYAVTARLLGSDSGLPDLDAARRKLVAASALATGLWAERVDHLIKHMERSPRDVGPITEELKQMLEDKPSGQLAVLLRSAWTDIQKD